MKDLFKVFFIRFSKKVLPWLLGAGVGVCLLFSCKGLWHISGEYKDDKGSGYNIVIDNDTKDNCEEKKDAETV